MNLDEFSSVRAFIRFLREEKGYSDENLLRDFTISKNHSRAIIDLLIIDGKNKDYLALVEFKKGKIESIDSYQVINYKEMLDKNDLATYLVCYEVDDKFKIYTLYNNKWVEIHKEDFPAFKTLVHTEFIKGKTALKNKKNKSINTFAVTCIVLSIISGILFVLSMFKVIKFTDTDIALFGATIALIIIPNATKLKILGVEFERHEEKDEK